MGPRILVWESDPVLRHAVARALAGIGYDTVPVEGLNALSRGMASCVPSAVLAEGDWETGALVHFDDPLPAPVGDGDGELAWLLPPDDCTAPATPSRSGIVVGSLRKPFDLQELATGVRSVLAMKSRIFDAPARWGRMLEARRLETEEEVLAALRLRSEVYQEVGYLGEGANGIDIDSSDAQSTLLGAFLHEHGRQQLVGSIRLIQESGVGPHTRALDTIVHRHGLVGQFQECTTPGSLPGCDSFHISPQTLRRSLPGFGTGRSEAGMVVADQVWELSRLVVHPRYRRLRMGIERRLLELIVVDSVVMQPKRNWFIIGVHPSKAAKYARYGFQQVSFLGEQAYVRLGQPAILMVLDLQRYLRLPNPFVKQLSANTLEYRMRRSLRVGIEAEREPMDLTVAA